MKKSYKVEGMTCGNCVASVQDKLSNIPGVKSAIVQLEAPQAVLDLEKDIPVRTLDHAIGKYSISEINELQDKVNKIPEVSFSTYKPLITIIGYILLVSILVQYPFTDFDPMLWMRHFMAGFFLGFSFFKLLNLSGFASSYQMYDIIASKWSAWGYIYPFVELGLGIAYLINFNPFMTNVATIVVLGLSSIGVIQSNLNKRKIKCACLGDVFNLPMSTVTIIEDVTMVAMAVWMLFQI